MFNMGSVSLEPLRPDSDSRPPRPASLDRLAKHARVGKVIAALLRRLHLGPFLPYLLLVALAAIFAAHVWHYWPYLSDDALISLRYARRFAEGLGLNFTPGERVEGYSDFLWVLLVAAGTWLHLDPIAVARGLGLLGAYAAIVLVGISPDQRRFSIARLTSGSLLLALSSPLAIWAIGGLEHGFMAGVLALGILLATRALETNAQRRSLILAGLPFAALSLLRADGVVLLAGLLAGGILSSRSPLWRARALGWIASTSVVALLGQVALRRWYYGQWVPNTALVKVSLSAERFRVGVEHVKNGLSPLALLVVLALLASIIALRKKPPERAMLPVWVCVIWTSYVGAVGGDIFPGWRQLSLILVPLALLVADGTELWWQTHPSRTFVTVLGLAALGAVHLQLQLDDSEDQRGKSERWPWDGEGVGAVLKKAFGKKAPLLAVDAAGALPYFSGLPCLDMLGLNDAYLPRHPPPGFGGAGIGHDLGDGNYVWRRSPDIIAFNNAAGWAEPQFVGGRQLIQKRAFSQTYQFVRVLGATGTHAVGELFIKRRGGKLGIVQKKDRIEIPGYFFASRETAAAFTLDPNGTPGVPLDPKRPAILPDIEVPPGLWELATDPPAAAERSGFLCGPTSALPTGTHGPPSLLVTRTRRISILLARGTKALPGLALHSATLLRRASGPSRYLCPPGHGPVLVPDDLFFGKAQENDDWRLPENIVFGPEGLTFTLANPSHAQHLEIAVDNNDNYEIGWLLGDRVLGHAQIDPRVNLGGMAVHQIPVPEPASHTGFDRVQILPRGGDGRYSVGLMKMK